METVTDQELLQRAHNLEREALAEIYDRWSPGLYRYSMRLLGEADLAEECVAEVFSRFLEVLQDGRGPRDYLQAYLFRMAHNWVTDFYRKKPELLVPLEIDLQGSETDDPPAVTARLMEQHDLVSALMKLTPDQRQVILLKFVEDWENEAIAQALQKPVGAVKSLQHRALENLRRTMRRQNGSESEDEEEDLSLR